MAHLIQLTSHPALMNYAKRKFSLDELPVGERVQSDRAESFVVKLLPRYHTLAELSILMPTFTSLIHNHEKARCVLEAMVKRKIVESDVDRVKGIGFEAAKGEYAGLTKLALDNQLRMIEWMYALCVFRDAYDFVHQQKKAFEGSKKEERIKTRELTALMSQAEKMKTKIAGIQANIDVQIGYRVEWENKLEETQRNIDLIISASERT